MDPGRQLSGLLVAQLHGDSSAPAFEDWKQAKRSILCGTEKLRMETPGVMTIAAKQLYAAFFRRDVASMLAALTEDVVWAEPTNPFNPADGVRHGHAAFLEWLRIGNEAEEILAFEPRQLLASEDSVAVVGFTRYRARATGKLYETDFVHLITFRTAGSSGSRNFLDTFAAGEA